jgi:hypothetical protein
MKNVDMPVTSSKPPHRRQRVLIFCSRGVTGEFF